MIGQRRRLMSETTASHRSRSRCRRPHSWHFRSELPRAQNHQKLRLMIFFKVILIKKMTRVNECLGNNYKDAR